MGTAQLQHLLLLIDLGALKLFLLLLVFTDLHGKNTGNEADNVLIKIFVCIKIKCFLSSF